MMSGLHHGFLILRNKVVISRFSWWNIMKIYVIIWPEIPVPFFCLVHFSEIFPFFLPAVCISSTFFFSTTWPLYPGHGLTEIAVGKCYLQLCAEHGIETGLATLERLCPENGSGIRSRSWRLGFFERIFALIKGPWFSGGWKSQPQWDAPMGWSFSRTEVWLLMEPSRESLRAMNMAFHHYSPRRANP